MSDVVIPKDSLEGKSLLPEWLRYIARDIEKGSVGPVIRDLRTLADHIEAAYGAD